MFIDGEWRDATSGATVEATSPATGESLGPVAIVESGVDVPRHHLVVRDILLVAGQRSDEVASLTLDVRSGVPGRVRHRAEVPSPTCLLRV